jgi:hypothetical protein
VPRRNLWPPVHTAEAAQAEPERPWYGQLPRFPEAAGHVEHALIVPFARRRVHDPWVTFLSVRKYYRRDSLKFKQEGTRTPRA